MFVLKQPSNQGPTGTNVSPAGLGCGHPDVEGKVRRTTGVKLQANTPLVPKSTLLPRPCGHAGSP